MTIRKRLFVSNILMTVIPIALGILLVVVTDLVLSGVLQIGGNQNLEDGEPIEWTMRQTDELAMEYIRFGDMEKLKQSIAAFNYGRKDAAQMILYHNGAAVYPTEGIQQTEALQLLGKVDNGSLLLIGQSAAYAAGTGEYRLILSNPAHTPSTGGFGPAYQQYVEGVGGLMMLGVIAIILLTNLILMRRMYKSIMVPLNTLVEGVHEIRDGNMEYRIDYKAKDEFDSVAENFNEMAGYLQEMVNARQRDNENRKELVAGISHDLRTPLTSIKAYLEGLESGIADTPAMQQKYFETVKSKTADIEHIVNQLFLFSKLDVGEFPFMLEKTDLYDMVSAYVESIRDEYRQKGLRITLLAKDVPSLVMVDEVQLRNVLTNLLENSVKYGNRTDGRMNIMLTQEKGVATLALTDNGKGVPAAALNRLFDAFYREDLSRNNPSRGSGLGLAIAAKIIEGFGGAIRAGNAAEGGLSVTITLPVWPEEEV